MQVRVKAERLLPVAPIHFRVPIRILVVPLDITVQVSQVTVEKVMLEIPDLATKD